MFLLTEGADVNAKGLVSIVDVHREYTYRLHVTSGLMTIIDMQYGTTALIRASEIGYLNVCQLLLTEGADITAKNNVSTVDVHREYTYRLHHHPYRHLYM
jgi:hypothetical protein